MNSSRKNHSVLQGKSDGKSGWQKSLELNVNLRYVIGGDNTAVENDA